MFENEIEKIIFSVEKKSFSGKQHISFCDIKALNIPDCIKNYFHYELENKYNKEITHFERESKFKYSIPKVKQLQKETKSILFLNYSFQKNEFLEIFEDGLNLMINFLVRPQWTLENFIFGNSDSIPLTTVLQKFDIFSHYSYYKNILSKIFEKQTQNFISKENFKFFISKIDEEYFKQKFAKEIFQHIKPIFEILNFETNLNTVPNKALTIFFSEKQINSVVKILNDKIENENKLNLSEDELLEILNYVETTEGCFVSQIVSESFEEQKEEIFETRNEFKIDEEILNSSTTESEIEALLKKPVNEELNFDKMQLDIPIYEVPQEEIKENLSVRDIRFFIGEKLRRKFIRKIFRKNENDYETSIDSLNQCQSWSEAKNNVMTILNNYGIDPYNSHIANVFVATIKSRFTE